MTCSGHDTASSLSNNAPIGTNFRAVQTQIRGSDMIFLPKDSDIQLYFG
jgi:hypothetical protein